MIVFIVAAVVALAGVLVGRAGAHAVLIGSTPADDEVVDQLPETVELRFDDVVELGGGDVEVVAPDGQTVQGEPQLADGNETIRIPIEAGGDPARGTYSVSWRLTSLDSHVISGTILFHVGERTGAAEGAGVAQGDDGAVEAIGYVGRWMGYAGSVAVVGAAVLAFVVSLGPADRAEAAEPGKRTGPAERAASRRLRWLAGAGAAVGALGVAVAMVSRVAETAGVGWFDGLGDVSDAIGDVRSVEYMAWRILFLVVAALAAAVWPLWRRAPLVVAGLGCISFAMSSWAGHAWTSDRRALTVAADVAHFSAVAVWIGGLVALLVALPVATDAGRLARRFSTLALGVVVLVALTGVTLGWQHLGDLGNLTSTGYGRYLTFKVLLVASLVGLGWLNRARLVAMVERSLLPLTRSVRAEACVALVVLGLTAGLVNQPPGRSEDGTDGGDGGDSASSVDGGGEPFSGTVAADPPNDGSAQLRLDVEPAMAGDNAMHLYFLDGDGQPLPVLNARAELAFGEDPPRPVDLPLLTPEHASASAVPFPRPGTWTVTVTALSAQLDETATFTFEVPIS